MNMSETLKAFLDNLAKKNTRDLYIRGIDMFCEFESKTVEQILAERKADLAPKEGEDLIEAKQRSTRLEKEIERFYLSLIVKSGDRAAYSPSSAYSYTKGILQILRYYEMPISLRKGSQIVEGSKYEGIGRYELKIEDVRKMFWHAKDLRTKLVISLATDLGFRVSDFLAIRACDLPSLEMPSPIEFTFETKKEHVKAHTCLSHTTVDLLKEYLNVYEIKGEMPLFSETQETIQRSLREVASACGIITKPKVLSFHCFRTLLISTAQNLGIDVHLYKRMVGKIIPRDMRGYSSKDVKEAFEKIQAVIAINGRILASEHHDILTQLGQQVSALSNKLETQQTTIKLTEKALSLIADALEQISEKNPNPNLKEISKAISNLREAQEPKS